MKSSKSKQNRQQQQQQQNQNQNKWQQQTPNEVTNSPTVTLLCVDSGGEEYAIVLKEVEGLSTCQVRSDQ